MIQPHCCKGERGNKPYDLSDMATEVIDRRAFSDFCGVNSGNQVPDGDTIGRFRALPVKHSLQEKRFGQAVQLLSDRGLILKFPGISGYCSVYCPIVRFILRKLIKSLIFFSCVTFILSIS